jgi:hypothetical protein
MYFLWNGTRGHISRVLQMSYGTKPWGSYARSLAIATIRGYQEHRQGVALTCSASVDRSSLSYDDDYLVVYLAQTQQSGA